MQSRRAAKVEGQDNRIAAVVPPPLTRRTDETFGGAHRTTPWRFENTVRSEKTLSVGADAYVAAEAAVRSLSMEKSVVENAVRFLEQLRLIRRRPKLDRELKRIHDGAGLRPIGPAKPIVVRV